MMSGTLAIALLAGIFSTLSPCVLPLVPGYVSFMSGMTLEELSRDTAPGAAVRHAGWESRFFVLGFLLVAVGPATTVKHVVVHGKLLWASCPETKDAAFDP